MYFIRHFSKMRYKSSKWSFLAHVQTSLWSGIWIIRVRGASVDVSHLEFILALTLPPCGHKFWFDWNYQHLLYQQVCKWTWKTQGKLHCSDLNAPLWNKINLQRMLDEMQIELFVEHKLLSRSGIFFSQWVIYSWYRSASSLGHCTYEFYQWCGSPWNFGDLN